MQTYLPMLAKSVASLPTSDEWSYELKFDGYRVLAIKEGRSVRLLSRTMTDLTTRFPSIAGAVARLKVDRVVLDGELCAVDTTGRPSFVGLQDIHRRIRPGPPGLSLAYYCFDLLSMNDHDWRQTPLGVRRRRLACVVADASPILFSMSLPGQLVDIERTVCQMGLEGLVAKRRGSVYRGGERSMDWQKVRFDLRGSFVIGGYLPRDDGFASLLVGVYRDGDLYYVGRVAEGFKKRTRAMVMAMLRGRSVVCPFSNLPQPVPYQRRHPFDQRLTREDMGRYRWVRPVVVAEIAYLGWTRHHLLRQGRFLGIRDDKIPHSVGLERTAS